MSVEAHDTEEHVERTAHTADIGQTSPSRSQRPDRVLRNRDIVLPMLNAQAEVGTTFPTFRSDPFGVKRDLQKAVLRGYIPRFLVALLIYSVGLFFDAFMQAWLQLNLANYYADRWAPKDAKYGNVTEWDVTFKFVPLFDTTKYPADWFSPDQMTKYVGIVLTIRLWLLTGPLSLRWPTLHRFLSLNGILFFLRGLCIVCTVAPNPDSTCTPKITDSSSVMWTALLVFVAKNTTCLDVMFSGHTMFLTLASLFLLKYIPQAPWFPSTRQTKVFSLWNMFQLALFVGYALGLYSIVASHFHYTDDAIVGILVTVGVFRAYHSAIEIAPFQTGCAYSFLVWYESYAPDLKVKHAELRKRVEAMKELDEEVAQGLIQEHSAEAILASGDADRILSFTSTGARQQHRCNTADAVDAILPLRQTNTWH